MTTTRRIRRANRFSTVRKSIVLVAVLAALLSTHAVGLAANDMTQVEDREATAGDVNALYDLGIVNGTTSTSEPGVVIVLDDQPSAAKPGVSVWGKCQVPGKCVVGIKITIRF